MLKTNKKYFFVFKFPFFCVLFFQGFCQRPGAWRGLGLRMPKFSVKNGTLQVQNQLQIKPKTQILPNACYVKEFLVSLYSNNSHFMYFSKPW